MITTKTKIAMYATILFFVLILANAMIQVVIYDDDDPFNEMESIAFKRGWVDAYKGLNYSYHNLEYVSYYSQGYNAGLSYLAREATP